MNGIESKSGDGVAIRPVTVGGSSSSGGGVTGGDLVRKCENYGRSSGEQNYSEKLGKSSGEQNYSEKLGKSSGEQNYSEKFGKSSGKQEDVGDDLEGERGMEEEFRRVKKIVDPKMPTKSEKENHELAGHLPFRSWCEHCIRGKGHEAGRYKTKEKKDALPEVHVDREAGQGVDPDVGDKRRTRGC